MTRDTPFINSHLTATVPACPWLGVRVPARHDLRHTWASWHVQRGTSLQELQGPGDGPRLRW